MINDYRFFQDFYDGQIKKEDAVWFKTSKLIMFLLVTITMLVLTAVKLIDPISMILLEFGMIWNFYLKLNSKFSVVMSVVVGLLYFYICSQFSLYSNALIYLAFYIPFELIAMTRDYADGDFVQIRKKLTNTNKIIYILIFAILFIALSLLNVNLNSKFILLDSLTASLLVCSAFLRNERYAEYYWFRFIALIASIVLWSFTLVEYQDAARVIPVIVMYSSYLIFDIFTLIYSRATYVNEYMLAQKIHEEEESKKLSEEKIKNYTSKPKKEVKENFNEQKKQKQVKSKKTTPPKSAQHSKTKRNS
ncbi:MAG: nicotinamide mononucleotide transporter [Clostridia bacterium]|nr:nicotinamide mononucleotide transporter [Clostridia bacterium]